MHDVYVDTILITTPIKNTDTEVKKASMGTNVFGFWESKQALIQVPFRGEILNTRTD
jgi:hypothetical protein